MDSLSLEDLAALSESVDTECKAAQGRDGRGELPEDFWKSYSAMANREGGTIWLGITEQPRGRFSAIGIQEVDRVRKDIWDNLNNRQKISANLLAERDIQPVSVEGKIVLRVVVPRARRQNKPVHLGANPFNNTYIRRHEGDYPADDETVRRMMAERVEDSRDERVLKGFGVGDLDSETVAAYRNRFSAVKPGHVWSDLPVEEFLDRIGAMGPNRDEGYTGLRVAGLLLFGRAEVIRDALPYYMVDYQERPDGPSDTRWIDRVVPDGSWSGNLYDFFRKVYPKLIADLKIPFKLHDGQRIEDTPVHEALREALVNTLIHADYTGRTSVLVVKQPGRFGFRNPGLMRTPMEDAIRGGTSDCRNRRLQTMFQLVGYGDHAGSGLPKIYRNWTGEHWRRPELREVQDPDRTEIELRMMSLLPPQALHQLESQFGERFRLLGSHERFALVTASQEGIVQNARLHTLTGAHPSDLTKMLGRLVRDGFLESRGTGRGTGYSLSGQSVQPDLFSWMTTPPSSPPPGEDSEGIPPGSPESGPKSPELAGKSPELGRKSPELGGKSPELMLTEADLTPELRAELEEITLPIRMGQARGDLAALDAVILELCRGRFLGKHLLGKLLDRNPDDLMRRNLRNLLATGKLNPASASPNHPKQAYTRTLPEEQNS
jgi:ATP-dependent DNA helicase RecG